MNMKNYQKGIAPLIIIAILALLGIGTGAAVYVSKKNSDQNATSTPVTAKTENKITTTKEAAAPTPVASVKTEVKTETKTEANTVPTITATVGTTLYYRQSGKDWKCARAWNTGNDVGNSVVRFSASYPDRYFWEINSNRGIAGGEIISHYKLFNLSEDTNYNWVIGFPPGYKEIGPDCPYKGDGGFSHYLANCVEKTQDKSFFQVPTDVNFDRTYGSREASCTTSGGKGS